MIEIKALSFFQGNTQSSDLTFEIALQNKGNSFYAKTRDNEGKKKNKEKNNYHAQVIKEQLKRTHLKRTLVVPWCSSYHYCTTSFIKA